MIFRNLLIKFVKFFFSNDTRFRENLLASFSKSAFYIQGQMDINPKGKWYNSDFVKETGGYYLLNDTVNRNIENIDFWDNTRKDMIILLLRRLLKYNIHGEMAEVGVYKGYTAKLIHHYMPEREFFLFDTFEGFFQKDIEEEEIKTGLIAQQEWFSDTNLSSVLDYINPLNHNIRVFKGYFPDSIDESIKNKTYSFVHLDVDLYNPTLKGLEYFYPRMSKGGILLIHDYMSWIGVHKSVDEFFENKLEKPLTMPDKNGSAVIIKY